MIEKSDERRGKTRRQVEELLAARFPRPDVREQISRLPVRAQLAAVPIEANVLASRVSGASSSPSIAPEIAAIPTNAVPVVPIVPIVPVVPVVPVVADARRRARELEPLSADRFGVHFTADAELRDLIERARALASHRLPNGDLAGLMRLMAACFVRHEEKRRFGIGARPRRVKTETAAALSTGQETPPGGVGTRPRDVPVLLRHAARCRKNRREKAQSLDDEQALIPDETRRGRM